MKLLVARFEAIKARDAAAAAAVVQSRRVQLDEVCRVHLSDRLVRPYFAPLAVLPAEGEIVQMADAVDHSSGARSCVGCR